jgi:hypothetical protein
MAMNVYRNIRSLTDDVDIITNDNWESITKTRYVHEITNHTFIRIDSSEKMEKFDINKINFNYELIVISDYDKGFLSNDDIEKICNSHPLVFVDTKKIIDSWIENAKYIKMNDIEFKNSKHNINDKIKEKVIHTLGAEGCEFKNKRFVVNKVEVKDSSGAGDSFIASLAVKYLATKDIEKSIKFANKCASEVVTHRGVTTI